jgi:Cu+-exporting ATPase
MLWKPYNLLLKECHGDKMKDPVCKMEVDEKSQFKSSYMGKTYAFCSVNCKQNFDKEPKKYARDE